jgi:hypothetical protein
MTISIKGYEVLIDDDDFKKIIRHKWQASGNKQGYVYFRRSSKFGKRWVLHYLHREIMDALPGEYIDHISGDTLDNRKSNLRKCTAQQNTWNSTGKKNSKSGAKGVKYDSKCKNRPWIARIFLDGREIHLGCYDTREKASRAYNEAAMKKHGEYYRKLRGEIN